MLHPVYSFVIPVFNEEESLRKMYEAMLQLFSKLDGDAELILIDDGSHDQSLTIMREIQAKDPRVKVLSFSRNFGHQVAISAGMDYAAGNAVVIMDADLQDPPEVVLEMAKKWREGFEIIYAVRKARKGESWFKLVTASLFYRLMQRLTDISLPADVGDFRLIDRKPLNAFLNMRERNRFARGLFSWIGFKQVGVEYIREERFAGETKYPFRKMLQLAINAILGFSNAPLRLTLKFGLFVSFASFLYGLYAVYLKFTGQFVVSGWTSMMVVMSFIGGIQLVVLGVMGEYLGRIYDEVKARPLYILKESLGFSAKIKE